MSTHTSDEKTFTADASNRGFCKHCGTSRAVHVAIGAAFHCPPVATPGAHFTGEDSVRQTAESSGPRELLTSNGNDELVWKVCESIRDSFSHCEKCSAEIDSPYGKGKQGCRLHAEEVIALVRGSSETRATPAAVLQWAVNSFGAIALNRDERAARMTEEAIEVAQVEGVPLEVIQRIAARVYSRPVGELGQEIGGLLVGLYALAANSGVDTDAEFRREFNRVLSKPKEWWARKHAEKVAAGTADLSPTQKALEPQCLCGCYSGGCGRDTGCLCDSTCPCGATNGPPAKGKGE